MEIFKDLPVLLFNTQQHWHNWLNENHEQSKGLWLKISKKSSDKTSVSCAEALEEALCYGWIDSQIQKYDGDYYLQKFTPRGPKSVWSKANVSSAEKLTKLSKMQPAGLKTIAQAKRDGRWSNAYDSSSSSTVPGDFKAALDENQKPSIFLKRSIGPTFMGSVGEFKLLVNLRLGKPE